MGKAVYFDDFKIIHKKFTFANPIQLDDYYPFGMQTADSWVADTTDVNNSLFNASSELNETTNNYQTFFRDYDPVLGRMTGLDIMANKYSAVTLYNYAFNDPNGLNDPYEEQHWYKEDGGDMYDPRRYHGEAVGGLTNSGMLFGNYAVGGTGDWANAYRSREANLAVMKDSYGRLLYNIPDPYDKSPEAESRRVKLANLWGTSYIVKSKQVEHNIWISGSDDQPVLCLGPVSTEYYLEVQNGGLTGFCETCPKPENSREFEKYKVDKGNSYTFLAGNWVKNGGKDGDVRVVNGRAYEHNFGRWVPMYVPNKEAVTNYMADYGANFLFSWGVTGVLSKVWGVSGVGIASSFIMGMGQAGMSDAQAFMNTYYSPSEIAILRNRAQALTEKLRRAAGGIDE